MILILYHYDHNVRERNECPLIYNKQVADIARSSRCFSKEQIVAAVLENDDERMQLEDSSQTSQGRLLKSQFHHFWGRPDLTFSRNDVQGTS